MRHFRHQPLLVWSLLLVCLCAVALVGLRAPERLVAEVHAGALSGSPVADVLLSDLPTLSTALGNDTLDAWAIKHRAAIASTVKAAAGSARETSWKRVDNSLVALAGADTGDRIEVFTAFDEVSASIMALVTSYR